LASVLEPASTAGASCIFETATEHMSEWNTGR
jgi:hypothetical protein